MNSRVLLIINALLVITIIYLLSQRGQNPEVSKSISKTVGAQLNRSSKLIESNNKKSITLNELRTVIREELTHLSKRDTYSYLRNQPLNKIAANKRDNIHKERKRQELEHVQEILSTHLSATEISQSNLEEFEFIAYSLGATEGSNLVKELAMAVNSGRLKITQ